MKYQHRVLGMLSLLAVITYVDRICIGVAGPRMQDDLGISPEAWGWVTSIFFISYRAFEIPTGLLGDRIGPRKVLTRVVLWWSAFTTLTGTVASYPWLLFVRFCFGIGEAGAYPNAGTVIGRWIPAPDRARAWDVVWMTSQIGAASPASRGAGPVTLRLASRLLRLRRRRGRVGDRVVRLVPRFSAQKPGVSQTELREIFLSLSIRRHPAAAAEPVRSLPGTGRQHYIVEYTGNSNLPFVPMVLTLSIGIVLWMTIDPAHQVFEEQESLAA